MEYDINKLIEEKTKIDGITAYELAKEGHYVTRDNITFLAVGHSLNTLVTWIEHKDSLKVDSRIGGFTEEELSFNDWIVAYDSKNAYKQINDVLDNYVSLEDMQITGQEALDALKSGLGKAFSTIVSEDGIQTISKIYTLETVDGVECLKETIVNHGEVDFDNPDKGITTSIINSLNNEELNKREYLVIG